MSLIRRLAVVLCVLALSPGSWAECAGWQASAEARRSCCEQGANCPHGTDDEGNRRGVTQAAADSCCASSESGESGPSATPFAASITPAVLQPALAAFAQPQLKTVFDLPELAGRHASPVPKHLFLSVFLV